MRLKVTLDIVVEFDDQSARELLNGNQDKYGEFEQTVRTVLTELDTKFDATFDDINVRRVSLPEDPE